VKVIYLCLLGELLLLLDLLLYGEHLTLSLQQFLVEVNEQRLKFVILAWKEKKRKIILTAV